MEEKQEGFELKVSIPANSEAVILLPTRNIENITDYGVCLHQSKDIVFLGVESNKTKIKIGSGNYLFFVKN